MKEKTLKSLVEKGEIVVPTYNKVFKVDISCENIKRMLTYMIDKGGYNVKRVCP